MHFIITLTVYFLINLCLIYTRFYKSHFRPSKIFKQFAIYYSPSILTEINQLGKIQKSAKNRKSNTKKEMEIKVILA